MDDKDRVPFLQDDEYNYQHAITVAKLSITLLSCHMRGAIVSLPSSRVIINSFIANLIRAILISFRCASALTLLSCSSASCSSRSGSCESCISCRCFSCLNSKFERKLKQFQLQDQQRVAERARSLQGLEV